MWKEKGLARSLKDQARNYLGSMGMNQEEQLRVQGVAIDFPYSEVGQASYDDYIPMDAFKNYEAMNDLFNPDKIPPKWVEFIKEVDRERRKNGCKGPVNLGSGIFFLTEESDYAQRVGLTKIGKLESGDMNFQDGERVAKIIDTVLDNTELRKEYKQILNNLIPDVSNSWLDKDRIQKVLGKTGIKGGILLDIGCGTGQQTHDWSEKLGLFTVGVERQYHREWYDPHWKKKNNKQKSLAFVRGDFNQAVPIKDESADVAVFQFVAQHVTQESMEHGLQETLRVLKPNGWLFVGPQTSADCSGWRYFRKEISKNGKEPYFEEYKYYDIVPEDKPKSLRWNRKN